MAPGHAILLNGVTQTANREIGVPKAQNEIVRAKGET
jgi:hypothetical protein